MSILLWILSSVTVVLFAIVIFFMSLLLSIIDGVQEGFRRGMNR